MSRTHLVIPDQHAHPDYGNERADYLARLIIDLQPDVVVNIGDAADMPSLSSYDKGKRSFVGRSYRADIDAHLEFQDRVWAPVKARKKKLPRRIILEGNHEHRIEKALDLSPELTGTIGFRDYDFESYYDDVVRYSGSTPGTIEVDGITYAHYFVSGIMGRPVSGSSPAKALIDKRHRSSTCGHSHLADWFATSVDGDWIMGAVAGVYQDYDAPWAGETNRMWWKGVLFCDNVENGRYDPQFISLNTLKKEYA
jgi:hypothetical protein